MTSVKEYVRRLFESSKPITPGIYHYQAPPDDPNDYRLHLRIEPDGTGSLIVNASTVLHLNQTAAEYAYYLVNNIPHEQAVKNITFRYRINKEQALNDYREFVDKVNTLIDTPDLDPVSYLGFDRTEPFTGKITAPYRLDCALTYEIREEKTSGTVPVERVERELHTSEWKIVLDKAWAVGIPHIIFTGGEPTLREDLLELIEYAQSCGQVSGLMTDGFRLDDPVYLEALLKTGLDHLTIIFQPENEVEWRVLEKVLAEDIFVAVHLTITLDNSQNIVQLLQRLAEMGVKAISLSANNPILSQVLQQAREYGASLNVELIWNVPVPYSVLNPVSLETEGKEQLEGAGRAWLYVEPDGDVLPSQGIQRKLGNILHDPWEKIWKQE